MNVAAVTKWRTHHTDTRQRRGSDGEHHRIPRSEGYQGPTKEGLRSSKEGYQGPTKERLRSAKEGYQGPTKEGIGRSREEKGGTKDFKEALRKE